MALDRFVRFGKKRKPLREQIGLVVEDYFASIAKEVKFDHGRWYVTLPGNRTEALGRTTVAELGGKFMSDEVRERWIEVVLGDDHVDVLTRSMDEPTNALAAGLERVLRRYFKLVEFEGGVQ
jgi:hypothetical protein